ncbi:MAG: four helix bundle protein [Flavobacteriaceae bacterium]
MKVKNVVAEKSFAFALRIVELVRSIQKEHGEYVLSKQVLRSGTSIGALIPEAEHAESKRDFAHKMAISLKEANETRYWLELLYRSDFCDARLYKPLWDENTQIIKLLASIVKSSKLNAR